MPIVAGISLTKFETGSPVTVHLLSFTTDNNGHTTKSSDNTFIQPILDCSDLSSTFAAIAAAFPEETVQATLALPSYILILDSAHKLIVRAAHKVRQFRTILVASNLRLVKTQLGFDPINRNELSVELSPHIAYAWLVYIEEDEGILYGELLKEVSVSLPTESFEDTLDVLGATVDDMKEVLKASPTESGSEIKNIFIIGDDEPVLTALSTKIKANFVGGNIIFSPGDCTKYAKYAAEYALAKYQEFNNGDDLLTLGCVFNCVPLRIGIAKADGFVLTALRQNTTLPQEQSCLLTTSTDNQTTATIKIVVGVGPETKDNTPIAELVLKDLKPRPRGETIIKVSFDVEQLGKTTIIAEELGEEGTGAGGARTSVELKDVLGNDLFGDDLEDILEAAASLSGSPCATEAENRWAGERAQGDLPQ